MADKKLTYTISSDDIGSTLTDFPVLLSLQSAGSGLTSLDCSDVFTELPGVDDWKKIHVTDSNDNELYCEVEEWDVADERAAIHVKVPSVSSSADTVLTLDYDSTNSDNSAYIGTTGTNPAQQVWDDNFVFLSHQAQDPSGTAPQVLDSTNYAMHGTSYGSMTSGDLIDGTVGKMLEYDGTDDYTNHGYNAAHNITTTLTLEMSFTSNVLMDSSLTNLVGLVSRSYVPTDNEDTYNFFINSSGLLQLGTNGGNIQGTKASWVADTDFVIAGTYNSTGLVGDLFVDGVKETLTANGYDTMAGSSNSLLIGKNSDVNHLFSGAVREVRVSNVVRSDDWINTTNLSLTDTLFTVALPTGLVTNYYDFKYDIHNYNYITDQYYNLLYDFTGNLVTNYYDLIYGDIALKYYNFIYGAAPTTISIYNFYYQSAPETTQYYNFLYSQAHRTVQTYDFKYDCYLPAVQFYNLLYNITGNQVTSSYDFIYDIENINFAEGYYDFLYNIVGASSRTVYVTQPNVPGQPAPPPGATATPVGVTVSGTPMPFNDINVERSKGQYYISGAFTLNNPAYYHLLTRHVPVVITIGDVDFHLILTEVQKQIKLESSVRTVVCRSPAVLLDDRDTDTLQQEFPEGLASVLATNIAALKDVSLTWNLKHKGAIVDQTVQAGTFIASDEKPLAVLRTLVNSMGGILQSQPDGSIEVVHKYQERTPDWVTAATEGTLNDYLHFKELSVSKEEGTGVNTVNVSDHDTSSETYSWEEVEISATQKEILGYQVPWALHDKSVLETSGGDDVVIQYVGEFEVTTPLYTEDPELIEFVSGVGSVSKPVYSIVEYDWDEVDLGAVDFTEDGQLTADILGESLLKVRYKTRYMKWLVTSPTLPDVQFILRSIDE